MIWFLLFISLISLTVNVVLVLYIRNLFKTLMFDAEILDFINTSLQSFENHIGKLSDLPLFYGDEQVKGLMKHSKLVVQDIRKFRHIYQLVEDIEEEERYYDEGEYEEGGFVHLDEYGNEIEETERKTVFQSS